MGKKWDFTYEIKIENVISKDKEKNNVNIFILTSQYAIVSARKSHLYTFVSNNFLYSLNETFPESSLD